MDARAARSSCLYDESVGEIQIAIPYGLYCQVLAFMNADFNLGRVEEIVADAIRAFIRTRRRQIRKLPIVHPSDILRR
jgi:hypothetical protein